MENKYFTPDIEDLCIGYECELLMNTNVSIINPTSNAPEFKPFIFEKNKIELLIELHDSIRVPYLTKEQIEAEGWYKVNDSYPIQTFKHSVNVDVEIIYNYETHYLFITIPGTIVFVDPYINYKANLFSGNCKDINTFRKIIKLLGI